METLTRREREVLTMTARGLRNAYDLGTVRSRGLQGGERNGELIFACA